MLPRLVRGSMTADEKIAVTAAVKATAAGALTEFACPAGWSKHVVVIKKDEIATALGVTLSNLEEPDDQHPVVLSIAEGGAAATPAYQSKGRLMVGDRILMLTGATNVHATDWMYGCDEAAKATLNMLKKSSSRMVNLRVERDGTDKVITVEKSASGDLGMVIESNTTWAHPIVRVVEPQSPCRGVVQVGDKVKSVEAAYNDVTLDTRHAGAAKVATGLLKDVVGNVYIPCRAAHGRLEGKDGDGGGDGRRGCHRAEDGRRRR
jgi:hypothetical protein